MSLRALLVDDEERARRTLSHFLTEQHVQIVAECSNVPDAVLAINKHNPDVVFLDVEMPEYNGFELLNFIKQVDFEIVFVTAYSEYAIRAFEVSAIDYLLKPVQPEALRTAVEKVIQRKKTYALQQRIELLKDTLTNSDIKKIAIPMNDGLLFIEVTEIVLIEADGAYCNVFLKNGSKVFVSKKLKFFEDLLSKREFFFRPHRSYLININYIKKYLRGESSIQMDNATTVVLARERKQEFETMLKKFGVSS